jgi:hypothetical protein
MSWVICTIRKVLADARKESPVPLALDFAVCAAGLIVWFVVTGFLTAMVP